MGRLTFRTIFGGPSMPNAYRTELDRIKASVARTELQYDLDLSLTIGSDMVPVTHPTGLRSPRINAGKRIVTGAIFVNDADTKARTDHAEFLKSVVSDAVDEILKRIAKKDPDFDPAEERAKLSYLIS